MERSLGGRTTDSKFALLKTTNGGGSGFDDHGVGVKGEKTKPKKGSRTP